MDENAKGLAAVLLIVFALGMVVGMAFGFTMVGLWS